MLDDRALDVDGGVFGIAAAVARQLDVGHRLARQLFVEQKRQDGMEVRRGRQLNLPALSEPAVQRQHLAQDFEVLVQERRLLFLREFFALVAQAAQQVVALEGERVDPGEVEPDLQVAQVVGPEAAQGLAGGIAAGTAAAVQLGVARER